LFKKKTFKVSGGSFPGVNRRDERVTVDRGPFKTLKVFLLSPYNLSDERTRVSAGPVLKKGAVLGDIVLHAVRGTAR
jgi:hypothetical protein